MNPETSTSLPKYIYSRITDPDTTRLLILQPAKDRLDPLSGTLCLLRLPSIATTETGPDTLPAEQHVEGIHAAETLHAPSQPYEAISYAWGDPTPTDEIVLGGNSVLHITSSIAQALRRLRLQEVDRAVWADQICINQKDMAERSEQVKLMGRLYSSAERVLVWLGSDLEEAGLGGQAENAKSLIEELDRLFGGAGNVDGYLSVQSNALDTFSMAQWEALEHFSILGYFDRAWIPQEIGGATPTELFWGNTCPPLDWEQLCRVMYGTWKLQYEQVGSEYLRRIHSARFRRLYRWFLDESGPIVSEADRLRRHGFIKSLLVMARQSASDPRDLVYSLLGHWSARVQVAGPDGGLRRTRRIVEPDYTKSKADIYREVAIATLQLPDNGSGTLKLFTLNAVAHERGWDDPERLKDAPSWVPQWDQSAYRNRRSIGMSESFSASGMQQPHIAFSRNSRVLLLPGAVIDVIGILSSDLQELEHMKNANRGLAGDRNRDDAATQLFSQIWSEHCGFDGKLDSRVEYRPSVEIPAVLNVTGRTSTSALWAYMETLSASLSPWHYEYPTDAADSRTVDMAAYLVDSFPEKVRAGNDQSILERASEGDSYIFIESVKDIARGRRFAVTNSRGFFVLAPDVTEVGDVLCILYGGTTPFILRPRGDHWLLVGGCFAYGLMFGEGIEMFERGEVEETLFHIE